MKGEKWTKSLVINLTRDGCNQVRSNLYAPFVSHPDKQADATAHNSP